MLMVCCMIVNITAGSLIIGHRFPSQSEGITRIHPLCWPTSCRRIARQASKACPMHLLLEHTPYELVPCRSPDAYHTLYSLAGLSSAQHHVYPSSARRAELVRIWTCSEGKNASFRWSMPIFMPEKTTFWMDFVNQPSRRLFLG